MVENMTIEGNRAVFTTLYLLTLRLHQLHNQLRNRGAYAVMGDALRQLGDSINQLDALAREIVGTIECEEGNDFDLLAHLEGKMRSSFEPEQDPPTPEEAPEVWEQNLRDNPETLCKLLIDLATASGYMRLFFQREPRVPLQAMWTIMLEAQMTMRDLCK